MKGRERNKLTIQIMEPIKKLFKDTLKHKINGSTMKYLNRKVFPLYCM